MALDNFNICNEFYIDMGRICRRLVCHCVRTRRPGVCGTGAIVRGRCIERIIHSMCYGSEKFCHQLFVFGWDTAHNWWVWWPGLAWLGFAGAVLQFNSIGFFAGYGNRYTTAECPEAIFVMCIQCIMGVFIQAFMVGIVFAKLSRPKKRAQTLLYSRNAVICHRDGVPCLMFRVGDMRKSHIIEAHVRAQIIRKKVNGHWIVYSRSAHGLLMGIK